MAEVLAKYEGFIPEDCWQTVPEAGKRDGYTRFRSDRVGAHAVVRPYKTSLPPKHGVYCDDWDTDEDERLNFGEGPLLTPVLEPLSLD
eukprot:gene13322-14363_t